MIVWLRRLLALIGGGVLVIVGLLAYQDNAGELAEFRFFGWRSGEVALFWWLTGSVTAGLLLGVALSVPLVVRLKLRMRKLERGTRSRGPNNHLGAPLPTAMPAASLPATATPAALPPPATDS